MIRPEIVSIQLTVQVGWMRGSLRGRACLRGGRRRSHSWCVAEESWTQRIWMGVLNDVFLACVWWKSELFSISIVFCFVCFVLLVHGHIHCTRRVVFCLFVCLFGLFVWFVCLFVCLFCLLLTSLCWHPHGQAVLLLKQFFWNSEPDCANAMLVRHLLSQQSKIVGDGHGALFASCSSCRRLIGAIRTVFHYVGKSKTCS